MTRLSSEKKNGDRILIPIGLCTEILRESFTLPLFTGFRNISISGKFKSFISFIRVLIQRAEYEIAYFIIS